MAPIIATTNVEQRTSSTASSDDSIANAITQEKHSWFRSLWPKRWSLNLKIPFTKKHKKKLYKEQPKVAISRSPKRWLLPIMIHIVPILAGIAIAAINLKGYFIGTQFVGVTNAQGQSTALFSLQVTAKVLEIFVIASLGFIVLDVVHYFLLFDEAGLPFSLAGARLTFNDISYLASPAFWRGIGALRSYSVRISVALLLVSCGVLATFIGPAAALLLIPSNNPTWPAGGLRFLLPQTISELWPMQLNSSHTGPSFCTNPSEATVSTPREQNQFCLWYSNTILSSNVLYGTMSAFGSLQVVDVSAWRDISWVSYDITGSVIQGITSSTSWAWSGTSIANIFSLVLYNHWAWAAEGYRGQVNQGQLQPLPLSYGRYQFRDLTGDQIMLPGMLAPSVRAHCLSSEQNFSSTATLPYPAIPTTGAYFVDTNATFLIPSLLAENTSIVRTFWTAKPTSTPEMQGVQANEGDNSQLPSALLLIQIPVGSESAGFVFTCSVDARWITNTTQLMHPFDARKLFSTSSGGSPTSYTQFDAATFDAQGRPGTIGISPPLDLDISWLEQLTPTLNETLPDTDTSFISPGFTSMAKSISTSPFQSFLEDDGAIYTVTERLESLAAMLTVDGLARINLASTLSWPVADTWVYSLNSTANAVDEYTLFAGAGGTDPITRDASELYYPEFLWTVSISGYGYAVESTGEILALVVIFVYIVFALGHICFILYKRWYSVDWWSVTDMIALSQNSPPSDLLKNTSGGIEAGSTHRLLLKLRAKDVPLGDRENIQVIVCSDKSDTNFQRPTGYHKIEKEKAYY